MTVFHFRLAAAAAIILFVAASAAQAASVITFGFTGETTSTGGSTVPVGSILPGEFAFRSDAVDEASTSNIGQYALLTGSITVDGQTLVMNHSITCCSFVNVLDNWGPSNIDRYNVSIGFSGQILGGQAFYRLAFNLEDESRTAFSSDALPLTPPSLAAFPDPAQSLIANGGIANPPVMTYDILSLALISSV